MDNAHVVSSAARDDYLDVDWTSSALIVVDFQRDLTDEGNHPIPGTSDVAPAVRHLVQTYRLVGRPIVHVVRLYPPGSSDVDLLRREAVEAGTRFLAPGTHGSEIVEGVLPDDTPLDTGRLLAGAPQHVGGDEVVMFKPRWSAFHRTDLHAWLTDRAVTSVVVAGCNLPNCPRATLFDASNRDYRAALVVDAVSQATPERLADLRLIGVSLVTTADVCSALRMTIRSA